MSDLEQAALLLVEKFAKDMGKKASQELIAALALLELIREKEPKDGLPVGAARKGKAF